MKLKNLFAAATIAAAMFVGVGAAQAHEHFSSVQITPTEVAPGIYMLMGAGGNIGVSSGDDGVFLIDDQFAPLTGKIKSAIAKLSDKSIRFVLNTHWHFDHTGGNENLGKEGVVIVAHDNVRKTMSVNQKISAFSRLIPAAEKIALPTITFNDRTTFHMNGETLQVIHIPRSHTDGDSFVHFQNGNVIHTGDIFFNGFYPFIDAEHGGTVDGMIKAVDTMLAMTNADTKIIPGHGPLATPKDLEVFRDMLKGVRDVIKPMIAAGKSKKEVIAAKPTQAFDPRWGRGFLKPDAFAGIAYDALK
ncbi:MAG: MBL fold metallo-hydrolase [Motiliproteus sp.]|nr:MBL fold metallo-hydrolase [Motiliproteus sp.]MCW9053405.1 MBL fold metallo-hydrolase [Motiliproteus sp.]